MSVHIYTLTIYLSPVSWRLHCSAPDCHGNQSARLGVDIISYGVCNPGDSCLVTEEWERNWVGSLQWVNDSNKQVFGNVCEIRALNFIVCGSLVFVAVTASWSFMLLTNALPCIHKHILQCASSHPFKCKIQNLFDVY